METLFIKLLEYGQTPLLLVLIFVVAFLVREIKKNGKEDVERASSLKKAITEEVAAIEKKFEARFDAHNSRFDAHDKRIKILELDCLRKDEFYRENSGWRMEVNRLSDQITKMTTSLIEKIIDLWKEQKKEVK